ncbi:Ig-like domain-containing protein [Roseivirga sp.]|uniref:Ig-like domain-containing protein n=1 Tax=Roseivirga sp. TaxID=1964215 RepID=UPI003B51E7FB
MKISVFHLFLSSLFSGILLFSPLDLKDLGAPSIGTTTFNDITTSASEVVGSSGSGSASASDVYSTGWDISATGGGTVSVRGQNNQGQLGDDNMLILATGGVSSFTIASNDGSGFKFNGMYLYTLTGSGSLASSITIQGKKLGSNVTGATLTQSSLSQSVWIQFDTSGDSDFNDIDEFVITVNSGSPVQIRFEDISISAAVAANAAPTASSFTANPSENLTYTFSTADFSYSDGDSDPLDHVLIEATPANGTLYLDADNDDVFDGGESVSVSQQISKADLDAGNLQYIQNGSTASSFQFEVNDGTDNSSGNYIATLSMLAVPTVTLSVAPTSKSESLTTATTVTATLSNSYGANTTVNLAFSGTATGSGVDYSLSGTSIVVGTGNTSNSITLTNVPDALYEGNETVIIDINSVTNGTESGTQQRTFTIIDDDSQPNATLEVLPIYNPITDESGGQAYVRGKIDAVAGTTITIPLSFSGTASGGGTDYSITGSTITLSPGETMDSIRITSQYDGIEEGSETVIVDMGSPTNAVESGTQQVTITIEDEDATFPSTTISTGASNPTNSSPFSVTITFSESVTGFVVGDISVGNGSASNFSGSGTTYTADITPSGEGTVTVDVGADVAADGFGNGNTAATQLSRSYDATAPTVSITTGASDPTNSSPFSATFTFSESVTGFALGDISVGNGSASNLAGSGDTYTADITPSGDGTVTVDVNAGVATDAAGNSNTAATQLSLSYDGTAPTVTISTGTSDPTNSSPFSVTFTFSESVSGFVVGDISVGNGSASNFAGSGDTYTADITPSGDGTVTVDVNAGVATDGAGNSNTAATQLSLTYDATSPTVTISTGEGDPTNTSPFSTTFTFSESVTGFALGDISVGNGSASNLAGSGDTYTADITPSGDGTVTVDVNAGVATDAAGNSNTAATQLSLVYDVTGPTITGLGLNNSNQYVEIFSNEGLYNTNGGSGALEVSDIDISISGGTATNPVITSLKQNDGTTDLVGGETIIRVNFTTTGVADGGETVTINFADGSSVFDVLGNAAAASQSNNTRVLNDLTNPYVTGVSLAADNSYIDVTFNEAVYNDNCLGGALDATDFDLKITGGTASLNAITSVTKTDNTAATGGETSLRINFTLTGTPDGAETIEVDLQANEVFDQNGLTGDADQTSNNTATLNDETAPTVTVTTGASDPTNSSPFSVTITFSESVTGFVLGDISVGNGSASNLAGSGDTYTADITPSGDGTVTVGVNAGVATDAAGNSNTAATQLSLSYDGTAPTVTISTGASDPTNSSPFSATFTFSESVSGFVVGDISVGNGSASNFAGSGDTYTADITPSGDGTVTVDVNAGVATDAAGNSNTAATQLSLIYDATAPTITDITIPNSTAKVGDDITVSITAGETGLSLVSGSVNGVNVTGFVDNSDNTYSATYTVVEGNTDRAAVDDIPVSFVLADAAGNNSTAYTTPISQNADIIDANSPGIQSTSPVDGSTNLSTSGDSYLITFDENIAFGTGLIQLVDVTDASNTFSFDVTSSSDVSISGQELTITPTTSLDASTNYAIQIAATAIVDSNGNAFAGVLDNTTIDFTTSEANVSFSSSSISYDESYSGFSLPVSLYTPASGVDVTLDYTISGTATGGGVDHSLASGQITISAGNKTASIDFSSVVDDALDEDDETIIVTLSNPVNATLASPDVFTYTIEDNDDAPEVSLSVSPQDIDEAAGTTTITATLSAVSGKDVTVNLDLDANPGTATLTDDFTLSSNSIVITAGNTTGTATVTAVQDDLDEVFESINVAADPTNATVAALAGNVSITINDDDTSGFTVTESAGSSTVSETGTTDDFTVVLDSEPFSDVVLTVTSGDTGEGTVDASTLTFTSANWNTPQTVTVTGVDDDIIDGNSNVVITISVDDLNSEDNYDAVSDQTVTFINTDDDVAGFTITEADGSTTTSETATTDEFTIVLDAEPSSDVVLTVSSGDTGEGTVSPSTLTFTSANWNTPQTVTVTGVDDDIIDGTINYNVTVAVDDANSDDDFDGVVDQTVDVDNSDDDVAGFTVTESDGSTTTAETGTTDDFTVVLDAEPSSDVVINVTSGDTGEATVSVSSLTFTSANWNTPQTVTVTGVDDDIIDGTQTFNITMSIDAAGTDDDFDAVGDQTVSVDNSDDDVAGFTVTESDGSTSVSESGTTDDFTVVLDAEPASNVVINVTSGDTGEATVSVASLTFTTANWDTPQTVTVTGTDDTDLDGDQSTTITLAIDDASSDDDFDGLGDQTVSVTTVDDDTPGITIGESGGTTVTSETATTDDFTVVLDAAPVSDVVLTVTSGDTGEGTVSPSTLTFTTANWNTPQTVTVTGVDDDVIDGTINYNITVAVDAASSDDNYDGVASETVDVDNSDDDVAGFTITEADGSTTTSETATTDEFTIVLDAEPSSDVVLTVSSGDTGEGTVSPSTLTFTSANWNTPQTVTVTGVDDDIIDGTINYNVTVAVDDANSDDDFDGVVDQTVDVDNSDDDVAGFTVTESDGSTTTAETGTTDDFTVVLDAEPSSDVVINVTSGDTGEATVSVSSLTFTSANWNTPQTVTVTGVDDDIIDGTQTFNITMSIDAAGTDDDFDAVGDQTVSVDNSDDDVAGFTITESDSSTSVSESGTTDDFTVVLDAEPASNVVIDVTSGDTGEATVSAASLTFTTANWDTPQTVTVTGADDTDGDGTQTTIITLAIDDASSDDDFDALADQTVSVTTIDDDDVTAPAGYTITLDDALIGGAELTTSTFTFAGAEVGATYDYDITDGTTTVSGTGTIATATDQITLADLSSLNDGTLNLSVTLTDAAGNEGIAATDDTSLDATAPSAPVVSSISDDTGSSSSDGITSDNTPSVVGTAEANSTVEVFVDGSSVGTTTADASGDWTLTYNGTDPLSDGTIAVSAKATDAADNTSAESTVVNVTIDTSAPDAPVVNGITGDSGASSTDAIINDDSNMTISGTAEANATYELTFNGTTFSGLSVDANGDWSLDLSGFFGGVEGTQTVSVTVTDAAGNSSGVTTYDITLDTTPPDAPTIALATSSDTGISDSDNLTNDDTPTLEGKAEANSTVEVIVDDAKVAEVLADSNGDWSFTPPSRPQGVYRVKARAIDIAGNTGDESDEVSLTLDLNISAPVLSPADNAIDILPGANLEMTFAEDVYKGAGNIVIKLSSDNSILETIDVTGAKVTISGGTVTIDPDNALLPPASEFYVMIDAGALTDAAGNDYAGINNNTEWTFTTVAASVVTSVSVPSDGTYGIGDVLEFDLNFSLPITITGSPVLEATIGTNTVQATLQGSVSNSSTATFSYTVQEGDLDVNGIGLAGTITLNGATIKDAFDVDAITTLNNVGATTAVLVDGVKPTPTITSDAGTLINGAFTATFTYDETVSGLDISDITVTNGAASNFTSVTSGTVWTATITPAADGTTTVTLNADVATDAAGNASKAGNTVSTTFDGTVPTVNSITRAESDQIPTGTTSRDFTVTFSEDVTGVDATDFEVVTTGTATGSVNTVTAIDASTYTVNVNGISGEGTIGLNAKADDSIVDAAANALGATFTGEVYTTNFAPTDIGLSNSELQENNAIGDVIGTISTTDADAGDSFTYSLVAGTGDSGNGSFTISGDQLLAGAAYDFETQASYSIRVKTDDGFGGTYEEVITITVTNEAEAIIVVEGEGDFEQTILGLSSTKSWTVTNNGDVATEVRVISTSQGFSVLPGSIQVGAGETKNISAVFRPAEARLYDGVVVFNYDVTDDIKDNVIEIGLSGEGVIVTGVDNGQISDDQINLFPNPASTTITIDLSELNGLPVNIQMINPTGVSKLEKEGYDKSELTIDVSGFESGLYIIQFSNEKSLVRKKVLIRR